MSNFNIDEWMKDLELLYGDITGIAFGLEITKGAVSQWKVKRMIPAHRQLQLYIRHPNVFTQDRLTEEAMPEFLRKYLDYRDSLNPSAERVAA